MIAWRVRGTCLFGGYGLSQLCEAAVAAPVGVVADIVCKERSGQHAAAERRVRVFATSPALGLTEEQADGFVIVFFDRERQRCTS